MKKFNLYLGVAVSSWLLAIMVIAAELYAPFKEVLKVTFTHHWIGKAVITAIAFVLFGFLCKEKDKIGNFSDETIGWNSVWGSLLVIFLFYLVEFFV